MKARKLSLIGEQFPPTDMAPRSADLPLGHILAEVEMAGWAVLPASPNSSLLEIAALLGRPVESRRGGPLVDLLRPLSVIEAHPRSLSARYGMGLFPYHTDGAHMILPPRYALMRLAAGCSSDRATLISSPSVSALTEGKRRRLANDVWLVERGQRSFYASILSDTVLPGKRVWRFDPCCMRPADGFSGESADILQEAMAAGVCHSQDWTEGEILLIDNWRVLHARGGSDSHSTGSGRVVERVLVV